MSSPNLAIAHVAAAQNQKEVTINDAVDALDRAVTAAVDVDCAAGGVVAVSAATLRANARLVLGGAPVDPFTLELAAVRRPLLVRNATPVAATIRNPTGAETVRLDPGRHALVYSTGINVFGVGEAAAPVYDFGMLQGATPAPGAVMGKVVIPRALLLPADFTGAAGHVDTPPDAALWTIDITRNNVGIGTATISDAGSFAFATLAGAPVAILAGDVIRFVADPADAPAEASVAGIALTLAGSLL